MLVVLGSGNVGIGTSTPGSEFVVAADCTNIAANPGACSDYAEIYPASQPVEFGDIISIDNTQMATSGTNSLVQKSQVAYDNKILGIVSTNPAVVVEGNSVQLMNGAHYHLNPLSPAVALAGRVPVKIKADQAISVGDFITSSDVPGVGIKATHSGEVIGQALQNFDPAVNTDPAPTILMFIKPGYQVIGNPVNISALTSTGGLDLDNAQTAPLDILKNLFVNTSRASSSLSFIITDRLISGLDVTTQQLTSKSLNVDTIAPSLQKNISLILPGGGQFIVGSGLVNGLALDAEGNANFAGTVTAGAITAGQISSPEISALNNSVSGLSGVSSSTAAMLANLFSDYNDFKATTTQALGDLQNGQQNLSAKIDKMSVSLDSLLKTNGGLAADGSVVLPNGLSVDSITALSGELSIIGDVNFIGTPYFNADTAGFAIISSGDSEVNITFDNPYLEQPIVNASISADSTTTAGALDTFAAGIFSQNIQYIITNKSEQGFTILLNKPAPADIQFSWIALAVNSAKTFSSKLPNTDTTVAQTSAVASAPAGSSSASSSAASSSLASSSPASVAAAPTVAGDSTNAAENAPIAASSPDTATGTPTVIGGDTGAPATDTDGSVLAPTQDPSDPTSPDNAATSTP